MVPNASLLVWDLLCGTAPDTYVTHVFGCGKSISVYLSYKLLFWGNMVLQGNVMAVHLLLKSKCNSEKNFNVQFLL